MKILLFKTLQRPNMMNNPFRAHYLGFSSIRAYLNVHSPGHEVRYGNRSTDLHPRPDLIGISSVSEAWPNTVQLISMLRGQGFEGPIVVGGPHITALPITLPEGADCGVVGPGEVTFKELVDAYAQSRTPDLSEIPGLVWWEDGGLESSGTRESLPLDDLPVDVTEVPNIPFQISTVRGCPFYCRHCVERPNQGSPNYLSAERLYDIMTERVLATGNNLFFFQDDTFLAAPGRLEALHELLASRNELRKFRIQCVSLNANLVKEETLGLLKGIGVGALGMGCESFNPRVLKAMKLVVTAEDLDRTIRMAVKEKMTLGGSQVHGFPGETAAEMEDSIRRVQAYERTTTFRHWVVYVCQPLPGSKLWYQAEEDGLVSVDMDFSQLRIDGGAFKYFKSPWLYLNDKHVPRAQFRAILAKYGMLHGHF